jgi:hypothetical protein
VVDDLLARMRNNAAGDWKIDDIERLCRLHGIDCKPPAGGGSHYKVSHAAVAEILTIPAPSDKAALHQPARQVRPHRDSVASEE